MANLDKLRTLIPLEELEQEAQQQIYYALNLDFLKVLAVMPDCHVGYSLPIGGVALLDGVISPSYVGYDIGCGMCCIMSGEHVSYIYGKENYIFDDIYEKIPVGFNSREKGLDYKSFKSASGDKKLDKKVAKRLWVQIGTLGSGNHFIEIGEAYSRGSLSITIHSGSRNIGHSIASYWMKLSKNVDKDLPNGFLHLDGEYGKAYLQDMKFAQEYALYNRKIMMEKVLEILGLHHMYIRDMINENHNHAIVQSDGTVLHRKGATPADKGQLGVIPGNMKDGVYVTKGLGNDEYLSSASHGAGRRFSRRKAKETIDLDDFIKDMEGIVCKADKSTLDESRFAYKDISDVMSRQEGIVIEVVDYIKPIINIKGVSK